MNTCTTVRLTRLGSLALLSSFAAALAGCSSNHDESYVVGDSFALQGDKLASFNLNSLTDSTSTTALTGLASGETLVAIDTRPTDGKVYGLSSLGKLYTVDGATGAVTLKSTLAADAADATAPYTALAGTRFDIDFNPLVDRLRVVSDTGQNLRINVDTGATTTDGAINGAATGYSAAAYTSSFADACRTTLYTIDIATDRLLIQNPPNDGTAVVVGPLGRDATAIGGFDIVTDAAGVNTAYALLTVDGITRLNRIDLATGTATSVVALNGSANGLALPVTAGARTQAAGDVTGVTTGAKLVSFNRASPARLCTSTAITGLGAGETLLGADVRPADGKLYALTSASKLYTVDRATGVATLKSTLSTAVTAAAGGAAADAGVDFNPAADRLRVVTSTGQNLRINVDDGATTTDTSLTVGGAPRGATGVAYTNSYAGGSAGSLNTTTYYLDSASGVLATSTAPNAGTLTVVGTSLGATIGGVNGFDIDAANNTAYIAVKVGAATTSSLHTVDLTTGTASAAIGTVGGGEALVGLALNATPIVATAYGLTAEAAGSQKLLKFSPNAPAAATVVGTVLTGAGTETLLGLDYRPANGTLYALSSAGKLYTVNTSTAALTLASTLKADATDSTSPYQASSFGSATAYGVDFNPTVDRLRVVSNAGQNLRINVGTGDTTTDTNVALPTVAEAAYTNNFVGATATELFVIDTVTGNLLLQSPPNDGTVTVRGPLGVLLPSATAVGFDIAGNLTNGFVLASLKIGTSTQSTLYRINLATGAATLVGTDVTSLIGPAGTPALRGLAIELK